MVINDLEATADEAVDNESSLSAFHSAFIPPIFAPE